MFNQVRLVDWSLTSQSYDGHDRRRRVALQAISPASGIFNMHRNFDAGAHGLKPLSRRMALVSIVYLTELAGVLRQVSNLQP